ncbi:sensor histidine kinase [Myroides pelagicus]|uniref:histidine kinase n=1 Tax=Myroides pelagicus TaxID=270914 RepID=A0A7K1GQ20_9FLAO|nr:HAMP domain-containing sensor histidine kinase [Myroides pelagicus]MEC4113465.1 HAMP domain-containing sensor histidine kinase [Myroides pelagicus]MTH31005.1 HAMP domain-containing protein [Myroides pelagicus]
MKIRTRLSLQFLGLFAILLLAVLVTIYTIVASQWQKNFYRQLEDRAVTVGHNYLAEDNFTTDEYNEVRLQFPRTLPKEEIRIYDARDYTPTFISEGQLKWDKSLLSTITKEHKLYKKKNNVYIVGIYYQDNEGDFIIMAKAIDEMGSAALHQLRTVMLMGLLIALIITFLLSRLFAQYLLTPITNIIYHIQDKNIKTLEEPISTEGMSKDEIHTLSQTINTLFKRLHESFENQQAFASHASHELKTPIASVLGNAEIALRQPREREEYEQVLKGVVKDAIHMDQIISNLLALSQIDSSVYTLNPICFEEFWFATIDHLIAQKSDININLNIDTDQDLHSLYLEGISQLLELAIINIILNADKFSNSQTVDLNMTTTNKEIVISVTDKGIGIKKEDLEKLTLPFFRSSNAFGVKGTGLGLSLSSKIINLHKGRLTIDSELNKFTTVTIYIPYIKRD